MLNQRLGYSSTDRLLIVNADDFGMCHAANTGITQLLQEKAISSATLMVPCPWAMEAAKVAVQNPEFNVGIHLTLTNEWAVYRWGPITRNANVDSLLNEDGYFLKSCPEVETRAKAEHVYTEMRNQVLTAIRWGVDPTHLDNHMGSIYGLYTYNDFLREAIDIGAEFRLPFRLPRQPRSYSDQMPKEVERIMLKGVEYADEKGVVLIDHLHALPYSKNEDDSFESLKQNVIKLLRNMQPGVTELILHPFHLTEELKSITSSWRKKYMEFELFRDEEIKRTLEEEEIQMIDWRMLRDCQRADSV